MIEGKKRSFEKINYTIRPSKQVERKLFIEALHILTKSGYDIPSYTYLGFGSIFYVDFILFHKYLNIKNMICVESEPIAQRMEFNQPYDFITLVMKPVSEIMPELGEEEKYLVWLDYDYAISKEVLDDINGFISKLIPGSIFIVTVEAEPKLPDPDEDKRVSKKEREERLVSLYNEQFRNYLPYSIKKSNLARNELPTMIADILLSAIKESIAGRLNLEFYQLFNLRYSDTTQMLTVGGILDNTERYRQIKNTGVFNLPCGGDGSKPIDISVPPLTTREKLWLDQQVHKVPEKRNILFEIDEKHVENYMKYYRYYPSYHEIIL